MKCVLCEVQNKPADLFNDMQSLNKYSLLNYYILDLIYNLLQI